MFWAPLNRGERRTVAAVVSAVAGLHVLGFAALFAFAGPGRYHLAKAGIPAIGLGVTAYTLGLRHAFDADHISAIDNTTRKLMAQGKRPLDRRLLVLARALDDRLRTLPADLGRRALARRPRRRRPLDAAPGGRLCRHRRVRRVSLSDRSDQHRGPGRHPEGVPSDEERSVRRGRSSSVSSTAAD